MMRKALAITSGAVLLTGCQFGGLNSLNMPGTAGHGTPSFDLIPDAKQVYARLRTAQSAA